MKKILLLIAVLLRLAAPGYAQLYITSNAMVNVSAGTTVQAPGNLTVTSTGQVANAGVIALTGNITNNAPDNIGGTWVFQGSAPQILTAASRLG